ncbi:relaxase domain-containing protein [Streptomyces sp. NPDC060235]|uniref:relaxase domain-containing protein n=1 Tax=Streptomyces sp. NPDC060235 TaxID=3347080 RepID=UPI00364E1544
MLTIRMAKLDGETERAVEPSVAPAAFARGEDLGDLRANTLWTGSAEALGLLGLGRGEEATAPQLGAAIAGRHVGTGAQVRADGAAYDLTFIVPASISWVWAQGDPTLRADVERAVLAGAHSSVEHLVRTRPLVDRTEPGQGFAAALALHVAGTTQASPEPPPPLLHVHIYLVGVLDASGTLRGPDHEELYEDSLTREGGAVGRARLAQDLRELGFDITPGTGRGGRSFEITGVPEGLLLVGQSADKGCAGLGEETERDYRNPDYRKPDCWE